MKIVLGLLLSLLLVACGGGGNEPFTADIQAGAPRPIANAAAMPAGQRVVIQMYQALYGMAPSNALMIDYAAQATADPAAFASILASNFDGVGNADLAKLVLDNLGVTGARVTAVNAKGQNEYIVLVDAVWQLFQAYPTMRGQVILNMINLLASLEADSTYGASAAAFNSQASINYSYSSSVTNTANAKPIDPNLSVSLKAAAGNLARSRASGSFIVTGWHDFSTLASPVQATPIYGTGTSGHQTPPSDGQYKNVPVIGFTETTTITTSSTTTTSRTFWYWWDYSLAIIVDSSKNIPVQQYSFPESVKAGSTGTLARSVNGGANSFLQTYSVSANTATSLIVDIVEVDANLYRSETRRSRYIIDIHGDITLMSVTQELSALGSLYESLTFTYQGSPPEIILPPAPVKPGTGTSTPKTYSVSATRMAQNFYSISGSSTILQTKFCYEFVYSDKATLKMTASTGSNDGTITFSNGASCDVAGAYGPVSLSGSYAATLTVETPPFYSDLATKSLFKADTSCFAFEYYSNSILNFNSGTILFGGGATCGLIGAYGLLRLS